MNSEKLESLFKPISIGKLEVRNRLVMAPMGTDFSATDGSVTDRLLDYYEERARGGVGLLIVENAFVDDKASRSEHDQLGLYSDGLIPRLNDLAEVIKAYGARAGVQINHCGRQKFLGTYPMVAPSPIPWEWTGVVPTELTIPQLEEIIDAFGDAARRVKQAGFDLVEVHGAHGYLITQFLSPYTNRRADNYGGPLKNRMRFALEVIENIRSKVGGSFPISFRISGCEYLSSGITLEEAKQTAIELEKAGIDTIHVSGGTHETVYAQIIPMYLPRGYNVHLAEAIKKVVNIPVIAAGAINDPILANEIIEDKKADLISMARPLLADPYLPTKAKEGKIEDIRKCIRCNECVQRLRDLKSFGCAINPEVGKEERYRIKSSLQPKRILVVGGGPAGLEAARVAALRGHAVTLCEKQDILGGNLVAASIPDFKNELSNLIEYYAVQLKKLGVRILLGKEVTCSTVRELAPDVVIVGVGSEPIIPDIPGVDKPLAVTAIDVLTGKAKVGKKIIVVGAGSIGSETAWFLAERGKDITIIEMLDEIPVEMERACKMVLLDQFAKYDVKMIPGVKLEEIRDGGVVVIDKNWKRRVIEGDTVVLALGLKPRTVLVEEFKKTFQNVYPIGDCVQARKIFEAIHEGAHIARQI